MVSLRVSDGNVGNGRLFRLAINTCRCGYYGLPTAGVAPASSGLRNRRLAKSSHVGSVAAPLRDALNRGWQSRTAASRSQNASATVTLIPFCSEDRGQKTSVLYSSSPARIRTRTNSFGKSHAPLLHHGAVSNAECGMRNQERTFKRLSFFPHSTFRIPHSPMDRPGVEPGSPARQAGVVPLDQQPNPMRNSELGVRNEDPPMLFIPHSAFRIRNCEDLQAPESNRTV